MTGPKRSGKYIKLILYLAVLVLVNIAGITLFFRIDLTSSKIYSLSEASKKVVSTLSEPLTIKVFFTKNLPAPHNNTEQYLQDLLKEYSIYSNKLFNYQFFDVSTKTGESSAEINESQKIANNYGIQPVQLQAIEKDEVKFQKAYMGLVLIHGDLIERIPTITTTDGLEYKLTSAIKKLNNKISALLALTDKIHIKLFLSSSLETVAPYMGLKNLSNIPGEIETIIKRLNKKNYGKLSYELVNPSLDKDLQDATENYNIMALSWPAISKANTQAGKGAIGIVMEYGAKSLTIPLMQVIQLPVFGTQYKLADMGEMGNIIDSNIERLIDINDDLGYLVDHGALDLSGAPSVGQPRQHDQNSATNFRTMVSNNYTIKNVSLKGKIIPGSLNCLVIARPTEKFTDYELFQIDQFLMQGKSIAFILDSFNEATSAGQQGMIQGQAPRYVPLKTGIEKLLAHYGISIQDSYVLDENSYRQTMPARLGGGERTIYFAPVIKNRQINKKLEFMKNIKELIALKISPLELMTERIKDNSLTVHRLFGSSEKSWQMRGRINLNPMFIKPPSSSEEMQSYPLAYLVEGNFPSYFAGKPLPVKEEAKNNSDQESEEVNSKISDNDTKQDNSVDSPRVDLSQIERKGQFLETSKSGKIFVMASADMLKNNLIDTNGTNPNAAFVMNVLDYLNGREDMAIMRSKEQSFNPLEDTQSGTKAILKSLNITGLPILVVLSGLAVWLRRRSRKKYIQMMFHK